MRPVVAVSVASLTACVASPHALVTVTTRTEFSLAHAVPTPSRQTVLLAPRTHDRLEPSALTTLTPHGRWQEHVAYGRVWIPFEADEPGFVPYLSRGAWVASAEGWYWQSEYVWGHIPFHYGRWVELEGVWAWAPGSRFAPAWVEWRVGNGWVGWSPLAPLGAEQVAPFVYCNVHALEGPGLYARTVRGAAAVSLFALTSPRRAGPLLPVHGLSEVSSPFELPPVIASGTASLFDTSRPLWGLGPPSTLDPIPRVLDGVTIEPDTQAQEAASTVDALRSRAGDISPLHSNGPRHFPGGYSIVPAWRGPSVSTSPTRTRVASPSPSPASRWERAVAMPPPAYDEPALPVVLPTWGRWSTGRDGAEGAIIPHAQPSPEVMGGLGPRRSAVPAAVPVPVPPMEQPMERSQGFTPHGPYVHVPPPRREPMAPLTRQ